METKNDMNTNFMQVPLAPIAPPMYYPGPTTVFTSGPATAPPMYPNIENQQQLLRSIAFPTVQNVAENSLNQNNQNNQMQPTVQESRPATVFILNGKHPVGPEPLKSNCPHCNTLQTSRVVSRISLKAHFVAIICCMMGLICLAPVPYCMNAFKTIHHYCNNCGQYIGSFPAK